MGKVLITGGTGFVGSHLAQHLLHGGYHVIILTRDQTKAQAISGATYIENLSDIHSTDDIDFIINLAGAPISERWSAAYQQKLLESRINVTTKVIELIQRLVKKPKKLISASAIGYYGSWNIEALDENSPFHAGFTHDLCDQWEVCAKQAEKYGTQTIIIRLGVVLGKNGGALSKMILPFLLGLGGRVGSGHQYFSWIHMDDVVSSLLFMMQRDTNASVYNLTAPNPVTNKNFANALGDVLKRPTILPFPGFMVKLIFGEMGKTLLLEGQRVMPKALEAEGYSFQFKYIQEALCDILKKK